MTGSAGEKKRLKEKRRLMIQALVHRICSPTTTAKRLKLMSQFLDTPLDKFTRNDCMLIWKGLFYAIWYTEMGKGCEQMVAVVAKGCAAQARGTVRGTETTNANLLLAAFDTLSKEWFGIDYIRLDKFSYLVRHLTQEAIRVEASVFFSEKDQNKEGETASGLIVDQILDSIASSLGLLYHFCDVFIEEMFKVMGERLRWDPRDKNQFMVSLMKPFIKQLVTINDVKTCETISGTVISGAMREIQAKESLLSKGLFLKDLTENLMKSGSDPQVRKRNRSIAYGLVVALKGKLKSVEEALEPPTGGRMSKKRKRVLDEAGTEDTEKSGFGRKRKLRRNLSSHEDKPESPFVRSIFPVASC